MAAKLNLTIDKGSTFQRKFTWSTKDTATNVVTPVDLTEFSAFLQIREEYDSPVALISLTSDNNQGITLTGSEGIIEIEITADQSSNIIVESGVWDLELHSNSTDYVKRLLEGRVKFRPEATR